MLCTEVTFKAWVCSAAETDKRSTALDKAVTDEFVVAGAMVMAVVPQLILNPFSGMRRHGRDHCVLKNQGRKIGLRSKRNRLSRLVSKSSSSSV